MGISPVSGCLFSSISESLYNLSYSPQAADQCNFSAIAYEFVKEGLLIYECEISDSKAQVRALTNIIGTLLNCRNFPTEDYEALITKTAQVSLCVIWWGSNEHSVRVVFCVLANMN